MTNVNEGLTAKLGIDDLFLSDVLGRRVQRWSMSADHLKSVAALVPSWHPADVLRSYADPVRAWTQSLDGRHNSVLVSAEAAVELYEAGITIYVRPIALLAPLEEAIAARLRLPRQLVSCGVFFNIGPAETGMHFDRVDTIAVQITGSKEWRVAPNRHIAHPTTNWAVRQPVSLELREYCHDGFPSELPQDAATYALEPGSVLYVPGGYWHETRTNTVGCSAHIHVLPYTWSDAVIEMLRCRLRRDSAWRANAHQLWRGTGPGWTVADVLPALRNVVSTLSDDDLVGHSGRPLSDRDPVCRRPCTALELSEQEDGAVCATISTSQHGVCRDVVVRVSRAGAEFLRCLAAGRVLAASDAAEEITGLALEEACELVHCLVEHGFVRPVHSRGIADSAPSTAEGPGQP